jgi:hypothetical protein
MHTIQTNFQTTGLPSHTISRAHIIGRGLDDGELRAAMLTIFAFHIEHDRCPKVAELNAAMGKVSGAGALLERLVSKGKLDIGGRGGYKLSPALREIANDPAYLPMHRADTGRADRPHQTQTPAPR